MNIENNNIKLLLQNIQHYYNESKELPKKFGGPSIYFHKECIKAAKEGFLGERHLEMLYATLTAWGMHRMGETTKTKLVDFEEFKKTILGFKEDIVKLDKVKLDKLEEYKREIKEIFIGLKISVSNSLIVANSKTMHHLFWDLIPPMDREHTIRFFGMRIKTNDTEEQFNLFWNILLGVKGIAQSKEFIELKKDTSTYGFVASSPKIVDDLIMAFVKEIKKVEFNDR